MTTEAVLTAAWNTDPVFRTIAKRLYGEDVSQEVIKQDLCAADEIIKSDPSPADLHVLGESKKPRKRKAALASASKSEILIFAKSYVDAVEAAYEDGLITGEGDLVSKAQARDRRGRFSGSYPHPDEGIDHPAFNKVPRSAKIALGLAGAGALGMGAALVGTHAIGSVRGAALGLNVWRKLLQSADPVERMLARAIAPEILRHNTKLLAGAVGAAGVSGLFGAKAGELSRQTVAELVVKPKFSRVRKDWSEFNAERKRKAQTAAGLVGGAAAGQGVYQAAAYGPRTVSRYVYNHDSDARAYRQLKNQLLGKTPLRGVREANQRVLSPAKRDKQVKAAWRALEEQNKTQGRPLSQQPLSIINRDLSGLSDAEVLRLQTIADNLKKKGYTTHPNWPWHSQPLRQVDLYRSLPKEIPGAKVERIIAHTHGGKTGVAIGTAATLAGAGLAAYALHEHFDDDKKVSKQVTWEGEFSKIDEDKRQVFGWASVTEIDGKPVVDLQGDYIHPSEMERAAYEYVLKSRIGGDMHRRDGLVAKSDMPLHVSDLIESFVVTPEKVAKMGLPAGSLPSGWWVGFKVHDENTWQEVKKGNRNGFSIHGLGNSAMKSLEEIDPTYTVLSKAYDESGDLEEFAANLQTIGEVTGNEFFKHLSHGIHHSQGGQVVGGVTGWVGGEQLGNAAGTALGMRFGKPGIGRFLGSVAGATIGTTLGSKVGSHVGSVKIQKPKKKAVPRPVRPAIVHASLVSKGVSTKNRSMAWGQDTNAIRAQAMQEATQAMIPQVAAQVAEIQQRQMLMMQQAPAQNWNVSVGPYANGPSGPVGPQQGPQSYGQ